MRTKEFKQNFYVFEELESVTNESGRQYMTPDGIWLDSVTTILGNKTPKTNLIEWQKRVGAEEAEKIRVQAGNRGTAVHNIAEQYLLGASHYPKGTMPVHIDTFKQIQPVLDEHIDCIYALEAPLYSIQLMCAGRTDCVAEWDGVPSIIDFKTSRKIKREEWIQNYFYQATAYAMMMEERTGLHVPQFVIVIAVDHEDPQVFVKQTANYVDEVREIFS